MTLRLGTRASPLARWQAEWVAAQMAALGVPLDLVLITTQGDQRQDRPIGALGTEGVFTKEIQRALLDNEIDLAVHSLKDLPTQSVPGLALAAVPLRGPVGDVLICPPGLTLATLPEGAEVATGSLRRRAQLWHHRPDLRMVDVRGNVDTRLRKLREGQFSALVLAEAGLARLDLAAEISQHLPPEILLPAVGQGALGIETRAADYSTREALKPLNDLATAQAVHAERTMLAALAGGCLAPIGGWCRLERPGVLCLTATVLSPDGAERLQAEATCTAGEALAAADALGRQVAQDLLRQGAAALIHLSRA